MAGESKEAKSTSSHERAFDEQLSQLTNSVNSLCFIYPQCFALNYTYCAFDSLWEEEPLVDCIDSVIGFNITLLLQQDRSGVQSIICPEHCEPGLFVTMDQSPVWSERASKRLDLSRCSLPDLMGADTHSPVDSRSSSVARQQGGVVDNGAMFGVVDDLHGDEL